MSELKPTCFASESVHSLIVCAASRCALFVPSRSSCAFGSAPVVRFSRSRPRPRQHLFTPSLRVERQSRLSRAASALVQGAILRRPAIRKHRSSPAHHRLSEADCSREQWWTGGARGEREAHEEHRRTGTRPHKRRRERDAEQTPKQAKNAVSVENRLRWRLDEHRPLSAAA